MPHLDTTDWRTVMEAAGGSPLARDELARRYLSPVKAYLAARWRSHHLASAVDDAVQEVFVDLFRERGVLQKADPELGTFRALLHGTARIIALRFEESAALRREQPAPSSVVRDALPLHEDAERAFDRAWAQDLVSEARALMAARLQARGERERRWLQLLELRFQDGKPIREIARLWQVDAAWLHHEFASAREAYRSALLTVVGRHHVGPPEAVEAECRRILALLG